MYENDKLKVAKWDAQNIVSHSLRMTKVYCLIFLLGI